MLSLINTNKVDGKMMSSNFNGYSWITIVAVGACALSLNAHSRTTNSNPTATSGELQDWRRFLSPQRESETALRRTPIAVLSEKLSRGVALVAVPATEHLAQQPFDLGPILRINAPGTHAPLT